VINFLHKSSVEDFMGKNTNNICFSIGLKEMINVAKGSHYDNMSMRKWKMN
jgi:hypothetical protein